MFAARRLLPPVNRNEKLCMINRNTIRRFSNDRFAPRTSFRINNLNLHIANGDICAFHGDAVVNAANERMLGGGGVDGAIHKAAGPKLLKWIKENIHTKEDNPNIRCYTGDAILTLGYDLNTSYIIHTPGPMYREHKNPEQLLRSCYDKCLQIAIEKDMKSIAFPAISCGVYAFPHYEAIEIAFTAFEELEELGCLEDIWFIVYGKDMFSEALAVADDLFV